MKLYLQQIKFPLGRLFISDTVAQSRGSQFTPFESNQQQRDIIADAKQRGDEFVFFMRATKGDVQSVGIFNDSRLMRDAIIEQIRTKGREDNPPTKQQIEAGVLKWALDKDVDRPGMINDCMNTTIAQDAYPPDSLFIFFGRAFIR